MVIGSSSPSWLYLPSVNGLTSLCQSTRVRGQGKVITSLKNKSIPLNNSNFISRAQMYSVNIFPSHEILGSFPYGGGKRLPSHIPRLLFDIIVCDE